MTKVSKINILVGLFFILLIILVVKPKIITNLYSSILGRGVLILIVLFFSMNNITLGLLTALIVIIASKMYLVEGVEVMNQVPQQKTSIVTPSDTLDIPNPKPNTVKLPDTISPKPTDKEEKQGIDIETIKKALESQDSGSLPITPPNTTGEPTASTVESFSSMYASV
jgi:hypothetical protein